MKECRGHERTGVGRDGGRGLARHRGRLALIAAVGVGIVVTLVPAAALAPPARAAPVPDGAAWTESYFRSGDGTRLHADVLRPKGLPPAARTPVILTVSPYLNQSGQTSDFDPAAQGPSDRFFDFVRQSHLFARGYSYVMVDLRGFGGSAGCNDWGGPGEQSDVKAAVEWAASRPWSTGKVGMYGKSYDGWTGIMALAERPRGLAAVVSMEPVIDGYRYLYMNRVRFETAVEEGAAFSLIDAKPGSAGSGIAYHANGNDPNKACYATNVGFQQQQDPGTAYWRSRNLIPRVRGARTPLFLTQGFLEDNTKPDKVFGLWNSLAGPKRAWFGQFDHVRGNEQDTRSGEFASGRSSWIAEVMRFYDHYVKGVPFSGAPTNRDPRVAVQQSDGRWRAEPRWPPRDSSTRDLALRPGSYTDEGGNRGDATKGGPNGRGIWTITRPFPYGAIVSGVPQVSLDVRASVPGANLVADVYDIAPNRAATLISRGAYLLNGSGRYTFETYGEDWLIPRGHRIGVLVTSANDEWWLHVPTHGVVQVRGGSVSLPFLRNARRGFIRGVATPKLLRYKSAAPFEVPSETIGAGEQRFAFPPRLRGK
jgi:uncharacterized protein